MSADATLVITAPMRRCLRAQPVLRLRELWNPLDPNSGAGQALAKVFAEVERQGLTLAGTAYITMSSPADEDGHIAGEAVVPVHREAETSAQIEATTVPATDAISTLYRDNVHLMSGAQAVEYLRKHAAAEGLILDGDPRWLYHTDPRWNLEPDDQLIEVLWPCHHATDAK